MNKVVNHCGNCPFSNTTYDEYSIHEQTTYKCGLSEFLSYEDYIIDDDNGVGYLEPPDWCPLIKEETFTLKFKRLSFGNVFEISILNQQIHQLDIELENIEDFNSDKYQKKYKEMEVLCEKLEKLRHEE